MQVTSLQTDDSAASELDQNRPEFIGEEVVTKPSCAAAAAALPPANDEAAPLSHDLRVLQSLRRLIRATDLFSHRLMKQHRISGPQLICLHKLAEAGELPLTQLSKAVYLSASTMVGIVDRLEAQDLLRRSRCGHDRRKVLVQITDAGRRLLQAAPSPLQDAIHRGLAALPEAEQAQIADNIARLVEMLELSELDAAPILVSGHRLDLSPEDLTPDLP